MANVSVYIIIVVVIIIIISSSGSSAIAFLWNSRVYYRMWICELHMF